MPNLNSQYITTTSSIINPFVKFCNTNHNVKSNDDDDYYDDGYFDDLRYYLESLKGIKEKKSKASEKDENDENLEAFVEKNISEAFDEGNESPYDLKDVIVESITRKITSKLSEKEQSNDGLSISMPNKKEKFLIIEQVYNALPVVVKRAMRESPKCFFSGGMLASILIGKTFDLSCDYDLFVDTQDEAKVKKAIAPYTSPIHTLGPSSYDGEKYKNYYLKIDGEKTKHSKINIISGDFNSFKDVVESFDFSFLQMAANFNSFGSRLEFNILNKEAWKHLILRVICFSKSFKKDKKSKKQILRIEKYKMRGFYDATYDDALLSRYLNI